MLTGAITGDPGNALRARLTGFTGFLRANGFGVGGSDAFALLESAGRVGLFDPQVLRWTAQALLCGRGDEWRRFDALFDAYFLPPNRKKVFESRVSEAMAERISAGGTRDGEAPEATPRQERGDAAVDDHGGVARDGASREESIAFTDFRDLQCAPDLRDIEASMRRFARRLKRLTLRREARSPRGRRLDLPRTIRRSVESGGTPLSLAWKDRRRVRPRLVLLLDVSRSMSLYSFFYLRLARALSAELADVHSFIFHTRITGVSEALRDPNPQHAQDRLHILSSGWAGGTRIGESLAGFNRIHAPRLVHSRTAVIIVSDGYDTGEPEELGAALGALARRARRIAWINPLLDLPGFTPASRGMQAALPHLDLLAPGANLASIERTLPKILDALA